MGNSKVSFNKSTAKAAAIDAAVDGKIYFSNDAAQQDRAIVLEGKVVAQANPDYVNEIHNDFNDVTPIKYGGTGAANAADARTNLDVYSKAEIDAHKVNGKDLRTAGGDVVLNGADIKLDGYAEATEKAAIAATDTVNGALGKIEYRLDQLGDNALEKVNAGNGIDVTDKIDHEQTISAKIDTATEKSAHAGTAYLTVGANGIKVAGINDEIDAAIADLDKADTAVDNQYVDAVSETDGIITVTRKDLPVIGVKANDTVLTLDTTNHVIGSTIALSYVHDDRKIYLKGVNDTDLGTIDCSDFIKDGMLYGETVFKATGTSQEVTIKGQTHTFTGLVKGHQYLALLFKTDDGETVTYSWDIVDFQGIIDVYTAGNGLQLGGEDNREFSIKIDSALNETYNDTAFLSVDASGLKVTGVAAAISAEIAKLDADKSSTTTDGHVTVQVTEVDGRIDSVVVTDDDIASAQDLADEIDRAKEREDEIDARTVNGYAISTNPVLNGADVKLTGYTAPAAGTAYTAPAATDTVNQAVAKLVAFADTPKVDSFAGKTGDILIDSTTGANGHITFAIDNDKKLSASVDGIDTAAFKSVEFFVGTSADTKDADTIYGAKAFATAAINDLDATVKTTAKDATPGTNVYVEVAQENGLLKSVSAELLWD